MPLRPASPRAGFTLIELLTVIAIIGILASILIPTIGKVRQTAKNTRCVSNLRQWGQAIVLYANDNKGNYVIRGLTPSGRDMTWVAVATKPEDMHYSPYLDNSKAQGDLRACPAHGSYPDINFTYYINRPRQGNAVSALNAVPLHKARTPSRLMLVSDYDTSAAANNGYCIIGTGGLQTYVTPLFASPDKDRHAGRANMVFADGHVQAVSQADIIANGDSWTRLDN